MTQRLAFSALFMLLLLAALSNLGCDSADNPIAPTGSSLSISANPTLIGLNGQSATLTITGFKPDGNPLNPNTQLTISTSLGVLRAANNINSASINLVTINDSGRATAYLFGDGRQGTATVTVSLTSGTDATMSTVDVQIGDDASSQPTVTVTANPTAISLDESSTITVTAKNADQSPLAGAEAIVRTSLGSLSFNNGNVTNSDGVVTLTLRSGQSGQAEVTATVGSSAEAMATVEIGTTRKPVVTLTANPNIIDIGESSAITVTARDENGNLLAGSSTAFVDATLGTLQGVTSDGRLTLSNGRGEATYVAGDVADQGMVTAFVDNSDIASVNITIRDQPTSITLTANPSEVDRGGEDDTITLTATVQSETGDPQNGELVRFSADDGLSFTCVPVTCTDTTGLEAGQNGVAIITMTFTDESLPAPGMDSFQVTAEVEDITGVATVTVTGTP